jgi:WD40 repeat protein
MSGSWRHGVDTAAGAARAQPATAAYRAFISYSHASERPLAVALQRGLHSLGRAWYRRPRFRVFRDDTSLAASPELWASIEQALNSSEYLVLLASPAAAASRWVGREVGWWLAHKRSDRLLVALTEGEIRWNEADGDFDRSATTALPPALYGSLTQEPFWVDLRALKESGQTSLRNPTFQDRVADLAATLHGRAKEDLVGEDLQQQRIWTRLRNSAIAVLAILTTVAIAASILFFLQRNEAQRQTAMAEAREFAARANEMTNPYAALALSVEAELRTDAQLPEARAAYARAVQRAGLLPARPSSSLIAGHTDQVHAVAWSPDGSRLASAAGDGSVRIWNTATGEAVGHPLRGHRDEGIRSVAWSPDGTRLASAYDDTTVMLWDPATGQPVGRPLGGGAHKPQGDTTSGAVAWSPDGTRLAAAGKDDTVVLWNVSTGQQVGKALPSGGIWSVAWSRDGSRLATAGWDNTVRLWEVRTGQAVGKPLRGHTTWVTSVTWSPDGTRLASADFGHTVLIWDARSTRARPKSLGDQAGNQVAWSPDGSRLASAGVAVRLWAAATGNRLGEPVKDYEATKFISRLLSVAWSPDGMRLASGNSDGTIRIWTLTESSATRPPTARHPIAASAGGVSDLAWSPDGRRLASGGSDGTVRFWAPRSGLQAGRPLRDPNGVRSVAWSPDGSRLASSGDKEIRIWDATTGREVKQLVGHEDVVVSVAWSPKGKWLASASQDGTVWLWDVGTGTPIGPPLGGHLEGATAVAWSPNGSQLATADVQGAIRLWRFSDASLIDTLSRDQSDSSVEWSPDGSRIATAGIDGVVRLYDVHTRSVTVAEAGNMGRLAEVVWSPDGRLLAAAEVESGSVWLLDSAAGALVGFVTHSETHLNAVAFSPDGVRLATGGLDGTIRFWTALSERQACQEAKEALSPDVFQGLLGKGRPTPRCDNPDSIANRPPIPIAPA